MALASMARIDAATRAALVLLATLGALGALAPAPVRAGIEDLKITGPALRDPIVRLAADGTVHFAVTTGLKLSKTVLVGRGVPGANGYEYRVVDVKTQFRTAFAADPHLWFDEADPKFGWFTFATGPATDIDKQVCTVPTFDGASTFDWSKARLFPGTIPTDEPTKHEPGVKCNSTSDCALVYGEVLASGWRTKAARWNGSWSTAETIPYVGLGEAVRPTGSAGRYEVYALDQDPRVTDFKDFNVLQTVVEFTPAPRAQVLGAVLGPMKGLATNLDAMGLFRHEGLTLSVASGTPPGGPRWVMCSRRDPRTGLFGLVLARSADGETWSPQITWPDGRGTYHLVSGNLAFDPVSRAFYAFYLKLVPLGKGKAGNSYGVCYRKVAEGSEKWGPEIYLVSRLPGKSLPPVGEDSEPFGNYLTCGSVRGGRTVVIFQGDCAGDSCRLKIYRGWP
jgi:hypothetical protein